ncbi:hypothetical protein L915_01376 [Phytophthora nicotianae]|uniref:Uncharacterized protein n=1 Tax=Phytophthora nicotianae TaxID=4792 RepID=W2P5A4_PHYNI|nr:hypothetical protein L915_01376 [Phytophthora nicotianae]ETL49115.1 hypothetical protein L916_01346 [Phytophthora nicotianae]ETM55413.1 hypothetical protein L914_01357 [Phytophthora nicotianae]
MVASGPTRPGPNTKQHHPREHKTTKASLVAKELINLLPNKATK